MGCGCKDKTKLTKENVENVAKRYTEATHEETRVFVKEVNGKEVYDFEIAYDKDRKPIYTNNPNMIIENGEIITTEII